MHEFLVAEWKTIVAIVIFGGAIFGWFYVEESERAEAMKKAETYEYTCLKAGRGILEYEIGMPQSDFDLRGFTKRTDSLLGVDFFRSHDKSVEVSFRDGKVVSVAYYPEFAADNSVCLNDAKHFLKKNKESAQSIPVEGRINHMYDGLVRVETVVGEEKNTHQADDVSSEGQEKKSEEMKLLSWIVVPK